jgi:hypothetical protein
MLKDQSKKNLQNAVFENQDLSNARFSDSDLRGANFRGSNLTGAEFTNVKTGITPLNTGLLFFLALGVSLLSGFVAMLAGRTIQLMLNSEDQKIRIAGILTIAIIILFIAYAWWKGDHNAVIRLITPVVILAIVIGIVAYVSGLGTGKGMLYLVLALLLIALMFFIGTAARAAAGTLSTILFFVVAASGGMFGRTVGGGIGTVVLAISCAMISKRALGGANGFEGLRKVAFFITSKFGTSFRDSRLANTNFSRSKIQNADFTDADVSTVKWDDSRKVNCLIDEKIVTDKKVSRKKE